MVAWKEWQKDGKWVVHWVEWMDQKMEDTSDRGPAERTDTCSADFGVEQRVH